MIGGIIEVLEHNLSKRNASGKQFAFLEIRTEPK